MSYPAKDGYLKDDNFDEHRNGHSSRGEINPYEKKYKEIKHKLKLIKNSYSHLQSQLAEARQTISRLNSRRSLLRNELVITERPNHDEDIEPTTPPKRRSPPEDPEFKPYDRRTVVPTRKAKNKAMLKESGRNIPEPSSTSSVSKEQGRSNPTSKEPSRSRPGPKDPRRNRGPSHPRIAQTMPRDDRGNYQLPLTIGKFRLIDLGTIEYTNKNFHSSRYIWPVGFTIQKYYHSTTRAGCYALYTATVQNEGGHPSFHIVANDNPNPIIGKTASGVWAAVVSKANQIKGLQRRNTASGPEHYGITDATIGNMIQDLPNARLCENYNWQEFQLEAPKKSPLLPLEYPIQASTSNLAASSRAEPTSLSHRPKVSSSLRQETTSHGSSKRYRAASDGSNDNSIADLILDMVDSSPGSENNSDDWS